ncbi:MAG: CrcB family protein [Firmicutes bacterium]|nr:CrcB family protein [Alicyclobacillaceae bacterium]MCL6498303.1 CrcB family protein [Bacillota bacterium]
MRSWAWVALGGALGALARYAAMRGLPDAPWPWAILAVNLSGAYAIGVVMACSVEWGRMSSRSRMFWGVGVLGGYTTFSTLIAGTLALVDENRAGAAAGYLALSVVGGIAGTWLGLVTVRAYAAWCRARSQASDS